MLKILKSTFEFFLSLVKAHYSKNTRRSDYDNVNVNYLTKNLYD